MTAYNREKYIAEAIESVLASSFTDFELIICDDCSTDNTYAIAEAYANIDNRVRLYRNKNNLGQFANRNYAAGLAKAELLKYLDSDDILYPHGLAVMVEEMKKFPEAGAAAEHEFPDSNENVPILFGCRELYLNHFTRGSTLLYKGPSASIYRKEVFFKSGMFDEKIGILADTLLMLKMAAIAPMIGLSKNLFFWRRHDEQVTEGQNDNKGMLRQRFEINRLALSGSKCPLSEKERSVIQTNLKSIQVRNIVRYLIRRKRFDEALQLFRFSDITISDVLVAFTRKNKLL